VCVRCDAVPHSYEKLWHLPHAMSFGWNEFDVSHLFTTRAFRFIKFNSSRPVTGAQFAEMQVLGQVLLDSPARDATCNVSVTVNGLTVTAPETVAYTDSHTPHVDAVSPSSGSVAGGTSVTLSGSGFGSCTECVAVQLDGVPCAVAAVNATAVTCTTGPRPDYTPPTVSLTVSSMGSAVVAGTAQFLYRDRWSAPATWQGLAPPVAGDLVVIPPGQHILLDVSPPPLSALIVEGSLTFADERDVALTAGYIIVRGGRLAVGSPSAPFTHRATITLTGNRTAPELPMFGAKVLGVHTGTVDLHGAPALPAWTRLTATAQVNGTTLQLVEAVNWPVGGVVEVASSDTDFTHAERVTIVDVRDGGRVLAVSPPLAFAHFGEVLEYHGEKFDMRAEVALLSRNVVVKGDDVTKAAQCVTGDVVCFCLFLLMCYMMHVVCVSVCRGAMGVCCCCCCCCPCGSWLSSSPGACSRVCRVRACVRACVRVCVCVCVCVCGVCGCGSQIRCHHHDAHHERQQHGGGSLFEL